jgi:asparagine synthase (glutamine-hydrolysing)
MCGIAGVLELHQSRADASLLERMLAPLAHRGPDGHGTWTRGLVGLAHARLSIVDLAGGAQPMGNEDGSIQITFNGEIFNYVELRAELLQKGHRFATHSDTEVLVHLYEEEGERCVERLNGQWAFAIWDERRGTLFLSRDRLGIRPLYYVKTAERFLFASEAKSIFVVPEVSRELSLEGLDQTFTYWCPIAPTTVFEALQELPPGHSMRVHDGQLHTWRYWSLRYDEPLELPEAQQAEQLRALLLDATRLRFQRADVPVGAYLSGGLDSTVITGLVRQFTDSPVETFSVTFEDAEYDESDFQRQAAAHLGVTHHQLPCSKIDIGRVFPDVIWHTERPLVRTAPAPMYLLARLVRQHGIKVVLTGEGADELLGGYDIFKEAKVRQFWARQPESQLRPRLLRSLYPYMPALQAQPDAYLKAFFHVRAEDAHSPFFSHLPRWELTAKNKLFFAKQVRARLGDRPAYAAASSRLPAGFAGWDYFSRAQWLETQILMPGYILSSQGDRVAMAHSVEGRFPFLDYRVAELAARIPARLKMRALDEKYLLKRAVADLIPPFLKARPKQPYRAPDVHCFFDPASGAARFEYVDELLSESVLRRSGLFNPQAVSKLVEKVRQGATIGVKDGMALVAILSTQLVAAQFTNRYGRMIT